MGKRHFMWNYHYKTFKFDFVGLATLIAVYILKILLPNIESLIKTNTPLFLQNEYYILSLNTVTIIK
jgi:hypothetical protein